MMFDPLRAEYKEMIYEGAQNEASLIGYQFLEIDQAQMWGEPSLIVNWSREGCFATGYDIVVTDKNLAIKNRKMPSRGQPGGIIIENHYYGNRADIIFTNPNMYPGVDTMTFSYTNKKDQFYKFNKIYSHQKKYKRVHNVIVWPYVMAAINWEDHKDIIMPGFSPLGIADYFYRMICQGEVEFEDLRGKKHAVYKIAAFKNETMEKITNATLMDSIPRTYWYISKEAPYYFGKEVLNRDKEGKEMFMRSETLIGFQKLEFSFRNRLDEMLKESKQYLEGLELLWIRE